jgi:Polysaccharide pyruvyl transferase
MKVLVAGWFSFDEGHATAGDLMARDVVCGWLSNAGFEFDIAVAAPFEGDVHVEYCDPRDYSRVVFVCGPFTEDGPLEVQFLNRFAKSFLMGLNLTIITSGEAWNPFDFLIERDSLRNSNPDIVFVSTQKKVPVVGVCLVEPYDGAMDAEANAAIARLIASREIATVQVDTRLDINATGLRSPAEIESLLSRMDVIITTRLHGMVLALKNAVPVIAIDPEAGGHKILRQAAAIGWPLAFAVDSVTDRKLTEAFDYCLTQEARAKTGVCSEQAKKAIAEIHRAFIDEMNNYPNVDAIDLKVKNRIPLAGKSAKNPVTMRKQHFFSKLKKRLWQ